MFPDDKNLLIIYDGECPFCSAYAKMLRLQQRFGKVRMISARSNEPELQEVVNLGIKVDNGIIIKWEGRFLQGAEAMQFLAMASSPSTVLSRLNQWIFSHPLIARGLYPLLYAGRNISLWLMGRGRISAG